MTTTGPNAGTSQGVGLPVGSKIGKYEVVERSGVGGQAIVYKCYDRSLDRFVAAKQISPHLAEDPKFVERFRKEAQILARLGAEGTSIVAIYELLEEPQGLFIVMEFVQGHALETILRETAGPTEPKAALQVLWRLAAALHVVHTAGIIHRDLKPGNIIVTEGLHPKITDFGVAASRTGQTSMLLGTTKYMAPELFSGGDADGRADLYSLGMIAYEMLLGRPRFNQVFEEIVRDPHSESLRWMKWHSNDQETATPLHQLDPAIPVPLSDIVARMMAKRPEERFDSMEALGRAIRTAFSPRGRAPVGAGAAAGLRHKPERAKAAAAAAAAGGMAADEGDQLDIGAPPPTAAIPRKPMSLATKLVLAGAGFLVLLGGVIFLVMRSTAEGRRIELAARAIYAAGDANYMAERFEDALAQFELVSRSYPGTSWAVKSLVMQPMTRARIAQRDANSPEGWNDVAAELAASEDQAKRVLTTSRELEAWARDRLSEIEDMRRNGVNLRIFRVEMARAEEAFRNKRYTGKDGTVGILDMLSPGGLSEEQRRSREALRQKALRADFEKRYADLVARADELAGVGSLDREMDYDGAKAALDGAVAMLQAPPPNFPSSEIETRSKDLSGKVDWLNKKRDYRRADRDLAEAGDNLQKKLGALYRKRDILAGMKLPVDAVNRQIARAHAEDFTKQAQDAYNNNKFQLAKDKADEALKHVPDHQPAKLILDRIKKGEDRRQLIAQGDARAAKGEDDQALVAYLDAERLQPDKELSDKIKQCRVRLMWKDVAKLEGEGKFKEAIAALEQIRALDSSQGTAVQARQDKIVVLIDYGDLIDKGDQAMGDKQYNEAKTFYEKARRKLDTPDVRQKIAMASYMSNFQLAAAAKADLNRDAAGAYAKIAKNYVKDAARSPEEAEKMIGECDKIIAWAGSGE